jgi:hypothetical protein
MFEVLMLILAIGAFALFLGYVNCEIFGGLKPST